MALSGSFIIPRTGGTEYLQGRIEWSATQSATNNTSTVRTRMIFKRTNAGYTTYGTGTFDITVNGVAYTTGSIAYTFTSADTVVLDKTQTITHDTNGTKSFTISASYSGNTPISGSGSQAFALNSIDRTAPSVSLSLSNITASSITINASANTACNIWEYTTNNGASWANFSTSSVTAASRVLTGLSPSVTYTIRVRARRTSNNVYGTSSARSATTLGGAILTSVSDVVIDSESPSIDYGITVYNESYNNTLRIKNGSTELFSVRGLFYTKGSSVQSLTFTAEQIDILLETMSNTAQMTVTYEITSYNGSTQIGNASSRTARVSTSSASFPEWSNEEGFVYADVNTATVAITGDDQRIVQTMSRLKCDAYTAVPKNHATIISYTATLNGVNYSSATTSIAIGVVSNYGQIRLTVTATDSRGHSVSKTKEIEVVRYSKITFENWSIARVNMVESYCYLAFSATFSSVNNLNEITLCQYRSKFANETDYSAWVTIEPSVSGTTVRFESDSFGDFNPDHAYDIEFYLADKFQSDTIVLTIPNGKPLMAFRKERVGINNPNPQSGLDVLGGVKADTIQTARITLNDIPLDYIVEQGSSGIWTYRKWDSGIAECWGSKTYSKTLTVAWGNLYSTGALGSVPYPFAFTDVPVESVTISNGSGPTCFLISEGAGNASKTQTADYSCARVTSYSTAYTIILNYHVIGRWK